MQATPEYQSLSAPGIPETFAEAGPLSRSPAPRLHRAVAEPVRGLLAGLSKGMPAERPPASPPNSARSPNDPNAHYCLDLRSDIDALRKLDDATLVERMRHEPRPIRRLKTNSSPRCIRCGTSMRAGSSTYRKAS
jgi:hypothetical protein